MMAAVKKARPDLSLILPCYNEKAILAQSLKLIVKTLTLSNLSWEIILVDDASADGTPKLIARICQKYPGCRALFHAKNLGRGATVADGIKASHGKVVGYIDIDCEVSPVYIPFMVSLILGSKAEIVIGKRFYRFTVKSLPREILSRGYRWLADRLVDTRGLDTETGYKFFRRRKILPILARVHHPGWFWDTEVMVLANRAGLSLVEVPVLFVRRFDKKSSVNVVRDITDYLVSLWRFRRRLGKV